MVTKTKVLHSKGFKTKDKQPKPIAEAKTYTRDPATDTWTDKAGKRFRLENHGTIRIDLKAI